MDVDLASQGIVMVYENRMGDAYPDMPWEPKKAFKILTDYYKEKSK